MNRILLVSIFIFHTISLSAQSRYMVFFKDKINSPWTVNNPSQFLSAKSLQRRQKQGISVEESDIPVNPSYISGVAATGAEVFYTTRWLNGLLVQSTPTINSLITALPYVDHVDYVAPGAPLMVGGRVDYSQQKMGTEEERTYFQNDMIGIQNMHDEGYMGNGIEIAVIDVGFEGVNTAGAFSDLLLSGRILSTFDYVTNSGNVYHYPPHGTIV
ncbi:MAG: hypothetical protein OEY51_01110, partial [Cyclobacteriaceae bacterium]|nr:hypothetical protein [Cyclobacteriaceae bacterium]